MSRRLAPALVALACLGALPATAGAAVGDLAIADEGAWLGSSGFVLRVGAGGGAPELLAAGAPLRDPWAVAVAGDGTLLVVDEGAEALFSVPPTGRVETVANGDGLQDPVGIALAPDGQAYVSDRQRDAVLRVDLETGAVAIVAPLANAGGLAMERSGKLLVADGVALRRVDPATGAVTTLAHGGPLDEPRDVAVAQDGTAYVAGDRQVVRVDPASGVRTVVASGAPLSEPSAIDIEPDGDLVVADRSADGGGVIHVDRETGAKTILASGGMFRAPMGVVVIGGAAYDASGGANGTDPDGPGPGGPGGPGGPSGPGDPGAPGTPGAPGAPTTPGAGTSAVPAGLSGILGVDFAAPAFLARPRLSATRFRAARRGRAFVSVRTGTRITWRLNEPARVTISVQKFRHLSRICRRKARRSRHRTGTRCRKWISLKGRYATAGAAGVGSVRFRGRLRGRALKPGSYRFVIRARDGAGNRSRPRRPAFRIVR